MSVSSASAEPDLLDVSEWTRHSTLYLTDGNIVLLGGNTVFRVYRGLLAKHSEVFEGMFSLSSHQPSDAEMYDGCPLARLSDTPEDLGYFLNTFIDIGYFPGDGGPIMFPVLAGILRLATKYIVPTLRARAIAHFRTSIPDTFEQAAMTATMATKQKLPGYFGGKGPHPFQLVSLFRESKVELFLPWSYLMSCTQGLEDILSGRTLSGTLLQLCPEDTQIATRGWRALIVAETHITFTVFAGNSENCAKRGCNDRLRARILSDFVQNRLVESGELFRRRRLEGYPCCAVCKTHWQNIEKAEMMKAWDKLPSYFNLPSWQDLRKEL